MVEDRIHVLMIEDDEEDYILTRDLLAEATGLRFECAWSRCLDEGLEHLAGDDTEVVLLDLKLPDSRGIDSFVRLRAQFKDVPVILLTGAADEETAVLAIQQGAQDYLVKGRVDRDGLVRSIRYAIERNRSDLSLRRYRNHLEELVAARTTELRQANRKLEDEVAERRKAEEEKDALQEALLEARRMESVGRLAGGVAHEFNNALTVVLGYAELLLGVFGENDEHRQDVLEIVHAGERAAGLTRQLLAFSRRQVMQPKVVSVNDVVAAANTMAISMLPPSIEVNTVPASEDVHTRADAGQVEQVFRNLFLNARDAMPDGGVITLEVQNVILDRSPDALTSGRYACVAVRDTGAGMDGDTLARAFEPFFSTKGVGSGCGLGLSVVYGVMKQHDGWVECSSRPGQGTVFRLYFPAVVQDSERLPGETDETLSLARGSGEHILLVEDESSVRQFLARAVGRHGYRVTTVASVAEAQEAFQKDPAGIDLVFSDVVLPDGNGVDLVSECLRKRAGVKVLLSSGHSRSELERSRIQEEGYPFLPKPYSLAELLERVREVLKT